MRHPEDLARMKPRRVCRERSADPVGFARLVRRLKPKHGRRRAVALAVSLLMEAFRAARSRRA